MLQALPDESDPATPLVPNADSDKAPAPAVLPTPSHDSKDEVLTSEPIRQSFAAERTSALISESEEEPSTVGGAQNELLLLAILSGGCSLATEEKEKMSR